MRLLFITSTRIGDAVLSTGLLEHLLVRNPGARVTVACGPSAVPLFEAVPQLERVIAVKKRPRNMHWVVLWREVVTQVWDLVVDLRASAMGYLVPTRRRMIGKARDPKLHRVVELGEQFGLPQPPAPRLWLTEADEAAARRFLPDGPAVLALGPATAWIGKRWPAERFVALAERLTGPAGLLPGARIAVFATEAERDQATPIIEALPAAQRVDLIGRASLREAAACLRRAALFIGNDSGLMHLSAAAGTPTLGLFGPSPDQRYAPWGADCAVVRTPESFEELTGGPQFDRKAVTASMMTGLTVEAVAVAAEDLWRKLRQQDGKKVGAGS